MSEQEVWVIKRCKAENCLKTLASSILTVLLFRLNAYLLWNIEMVNMIIRSSESRGCFYFIPRILPWLYNLPCVHGCKLFSLKSIFIFLLSIVQSSELFLFGLIRKCPNMPCYVVFCSDPWPWLTLILGIAMSLSWTINTQSGLVTPPASSFHIHSQQSKLIN